MNISYVKTTMENLGTVPLVNGQMITVIDTVNEQNKMYFDFYDADSGSVIRHPMISSGGGGGGGHVIKNGAGTSMTNRGNLQFIGGVVEDDSTRDTTKVYLWNAWVYITTKSADLYGETIVVTKDDTVVGTTVFSSEGEATFMVHEPGTYTFSVTTD